MSDERNPDRVVADAVATILSPTRAIRDDAIRILAAVGFRPDFLAYIIWQDFELSPTPDRLALRARDVDAIELNPVVNPYLKAWTTFSGGKGWLEPDRPVFIPIDRHNRATPDEHLDAGEIAHVAHTHTLGDTLAVTHKDMRDVIAVLLIDHTNAGPRANVVRWGDISEDADPAADAVVDPQHSLHHQLHTWKPIWADNAGRPPTATDPLLIPTEPHRLRHTDGNLQPLSHTAYQTVLRQRCHAAGHSSDTLRATWRID